MISDVPNDRAMWRQVWLWIGVGTILRLIYGSLLPLTPDEANYWQWGRHLAWGYHDQSPLIGWAIGLSTRLLGNTEWAVRLPTVLAMTVTCGYVAAFARRWFGAIVAFHATVLSQGLLLINAGGILSTADGVQAAAWAATAYHTSRAVDEHSWRQWFAAGCWLGLGLLSKLTVILFPLSILGFLLTSPTHRAHLRSAKPYTAAAVGLLLFAPVVWWNATHGWNTVRHVAWLGGVGRPLALRWNFFGEFTAAQAGLLSPLVVVALIWAWGWAWHQRRQPLAWPVIYCWWLSLPLVLMFTALSFHKRTYHNWPAMGYLMMIPIVTVLFRRRPCFWRWLVGSIYAYTVLALGVVLLQTSAWALPLPAKWDLPAKELLGWDVVGHRVATLRATLPDANRAFLFALRYQHASALAFYTPGQPDTVSINRWGRPNVYDYWWRDEDLLGRNAIGMMSGGQTNTPPFAILFERVDAPEILEIRRGNRPIKTYSLFRCYGFKGGLRGERLTPETATAGTP